MKSGIEKASRMELLQLLYDSRMENQALRERRDALEARLHFLEEQLAARQAYPTGAEPADRNAARAYAAGGHERSPFERPVHVSSEVGFAPEVPRVQDACERQAQEAPVEHAPQGGPDMQERLDKLEAMLYDMMRSFQNGSLR